MLTAEKIQQILQFMSRVDLKGGEAPVFMELVMLLRSLAPEAAAANGQILTQTAAQPEAE